MDENGNSTLTPDDRNRMTENFEGYDISPDMVRLSRVNMYLHGFATPHINEYDTLTSLDRWDDNFDVILANPPFMTPKGGITPHKRYRVDAKRAEVLFVDYIAEHLNPTGRSAIVVPEGIVFQSQTAYKNLRKMLVDEGYLYGVISLPSGVFNPYSGVKTSILLIDRTLAKEKDSILLVKLNNDGYDLGAQRREIKGSEIPEVINIFKNYQNGKELTGMKNVVVVSKSDIAKNDYILVGDRYKKEDIINSQYPTTKLKDICNIIVGGTPSKEHSEYWENGTIKWISSRYIDNYGNITDNNYITEEAVRKSSTKIAPKGSTILVTRVSIGKAAYCDEDYAINQDLTALIPGNAIDSKYLFYITQALKRTICDNALGIGVKGVTQKFVADLEIPLPPIEKQQSIVEEIESYQKIIDSARQIVGNYKPTIKINHQWNEVEVGDMYDISYGVTISIPQNADENGIKIISTAEVGLDGQLDLSGIRKVRYERKYEKFVLEPNTLLFNWRNAPKHVGKTAWFLQEDDRYISASFLLSMKNKNPDCYDNGFVWCALNNLRETGYFMRNARQAVNQSNFNGEQLAKTKLRMPNIDEQQRIMATIYEEMTIVEQNKRLIQIFEDKIKDKIAEVWGE